MVAEVKHYKLGYRLQQIMKLLSIAARFFFSVIAVALLLAMVFIPRLNSIQRAGNAPLAQLEQAVSVVRDRQGMAYVRAETTLDAIRAQGYVTAQDRLFQLLLTRIAISGRLSELFGESLLDRDKRQRTLGFYRAAVRHEPLLDEQTRSLFQAYADGINAYIANPAASIPLELRLAGVEPSPWRIVDSLALMYYMGWGSAADLNSELLTQAVIAKVGLDRYREIAPLNVYPHEQQSASAEQLGHTDSHQLRVGRNEAGPVASPEAGLEGSTESGTGNGISSQVGSDLSATNGPDSDLLKLALDTLEQFGCCQQNDIALGSNNWALSGERSPGGKPVVVNDPHLASTLLPTTFYPLGLITPEVRAVGVNVPGLPGLIIGRNQFVAAGVTNAYADAQDVYIETIDPNNPLHYLEGDASIPFTVIEEEIRVKDKSLDSGYRSERFTIRLTRRGPVISDLEDTEAPDTVGRVFTVRWSPFETMRPRVGLDYLLRARSVSDVRQIVADVTTVHLNLVFADTNGNLGWQVTGVIPYRRNNAGDIPLEVVDAEDNWTGWVPYELMPSGYEQPLGWTGTANHRTSPDSTPYYYSGYFSPDYRIRRMKELFDDGSEVSVDQHWQYMRDDRNLLARDVVPTIVDALNARAETKTFARILAAWDFHDRADATAPLIFQEIWRRMLEQTLGDELGPVLAGRVNRTAYYWSQRMHRWILDGQSTWFDVESTNATETLVDVIQAAAMAAHQSLQAQLGTDIEAWQWGDLHQMEFVNPLRREGIGKSLLGGGSHRMGGSAHTLYRASFDLAEPGNKVRYSAALRMVVDLADDDKVLAVLPGGVSGRLFSDNFVDQVDEYMNGEKLYWWFSDRLIDEHAQSEYKLLPSVP